MSNDIGVVSSLSRLSHGKNIVIVFINKINTSLHNTVLKAFLCNSETTGWQFWLFLIHHAKKCVHSARCVPLSCSKMCSEDHNVFSHWIKILVWVAVTKNATLLPSWGNSMNYINVNCTQPYTHLPLSLVKQHFIFCKCRPHPELNDIN